MAENSRTFTSIFDLVDNFTSKFDAIQKRANSISERTFNVGFDFSQSKAGQALDNIQKKVNDTTSTTNSWNNALGRAAGVADKTASSTQKIGNEAQKTTGFLGSMQSKLENVGGVADKLRDKFGAITGLLAGGSIGGMSWLNAMSSDKSAASFERRMARKGIDTKPIDEFIAKAEGTGYTTTGTRRDIADTLLTRTNLRGAKMESTTKSIEDLYFQNSYDLNKNGITSARDFSDLLTKKTLGPGDRQALIDIGFMNKNAKTMSVSNRLRAAQKQGAGIDEATLAAQDPYQAFLNRLSETSGKVGKTMVEPMNMVLGKVNDMLDLINNIPGAPGLIALVAVLMAAAGGASLLLTVLQPLGGVLKGLKLAETMKGMSGISGITKLFSGGGSLSALMNPYVALAALAAIILVVAYKTGVLQKAWDKFTQSAIGKDIMSGLQDVADFIGGLMDQLSKWYEASGKNQMLDVFFTLVEVLGTAWDFIDKIYSTMRSGGANPILAGIAAISAAPMALGMGVAKTITGKDPAELLGWIVDQDKNIVRWIVTTFPFFARIHEILKKVLSVFEWLYSLISGMVSFLKDALGITKEQKKSTWEKAMDASGVKWQNGKYVQNTAGREGWEIINPETSISNYKHIEKLRGKYEDAPAGLAGLADGIAKAVKEGISGIGTDIANAIKGLVMEIPGMPELAQAIADLQTWLEEHNLGGVVEGVKSTVSTGAGMAAFGAGYPIMASTYDAATNRSPIMESTLSNTFGTLAMGPLYGPTEAIYNIVTRNSEGESQPTAGQVAATYVNIQDPAQTLTKKQYDDLDPDQQAGWKAKYAAGARFSRGGLFAGIVDTTEEIIPQAVTQRGAGPISRALSVLDSVMSGQASAVGGTGEVHNHYHVAPHKYDFSGMKISSDLDVEKLIKRIVKESTEASNKAARDKIGLRRT